ncbi:PRC-barrel domain-containing protein [soil metagenome]
MTRIVRAGDLIGMPVVTLDKGRIVGEVRDVLFDPRQSTFVGFTLRGRGLLSSPLIGYMPGPAISSIGRDAVMLESESLIERGRDAIRQQIADHREVPGSEVVTESGAELGSINDIVLEIGLADVVVVVGYCVERSDGRELILPAPDTKIDWDEALVLPDGFETRSAEGLVGFSRVLEQARESRSGVGL